MQPYRAFLSASNFNLAFDRILTASNWQYKSFFRHLYSSYDLTRRFNIDHLIADIKSGKYEPRKSELVYFPKPSGVLRPMALLCLDDQIVYQAIVNVVARCFKRTQWSLTDKRTFGAIYAGDGDAFFYRDWKVSYRTFNRALTKSFQAGNVFFSEFDLVSYYELIDHGLLRKVLARKVHADNLLDLLFHCLARWTTNNQGHLEHGIPQGPVSSAFVAECFLFDFDRIRMPDVTYLRYVDDVRLLAKRPQPIMKGLIQLDLVSKGFGLVPQAQKITAPRKISSPRELTKTVPSLLQRPATAVRTQRQLKQLLAKSIRYRKRKWTIQDPTTFKFCLNRLTPTRSLLKRVVAIAKSCPELAPSISSYLKGFGRDAQVFGGALDILTNQPVYDAVAAAYLEVLATSGPVGRRSTILSTVRTVRDDSVEGSCNLKIALGDFVSRVRGLGWCLRFLQRQADALILTSVIESLFVSRTGAIFDLTAARPILRQMCRSHDPDTARYAAATIVSLGDLTWIPRTGCHSSVQILLFGAGLTRKGPKKSTVLEVFFNERMGIGTTLKWRKAFGSALRQVEQRCLRMQQLATGDQSARILIIDTFNDILTQHFCPAHAKIALDYKKGIKPKKHHPDLGWVVNAKFFSNLLPKTAAWFKLIHDARVGIDLAHATASGGANPGKHTKPIQRKEAEALMKGAKVAWGELLKEWSTIL